MEKISENSELLTQVLLYHVIPEKIMSTMISDGVEKNTLLDGESVKFSVNDNGIMINEKATVVTGDVMTKSGVVHVIDEVLLPEGAETMMGGSDPNMRTEDETSVSVYF